MEAFQVVKQYRTQGRIPAAHDDGVQRLLNTCTVCN